MTLTDTGIELCSTSEGRYLVTDGTGLFGGSPEQKGLWPFRYRFEGRPEKVLLVRCPNLSRKAARCKVTSSRRFWRASFPGRPDAYREAYLCSPCQGPLP